ncbi:MAG: aminodeoxychorismate synthase component I [Elusimicrobiota bacterium]
MFDIPDELLHSFVKKHKKFAIFETRKYDQNNRRSYFFLDPVHTIKINQLGEIEKRINEIESWVGRGYYAAGYFSYELGYGLDYPQGLTQKPLVSTCVKVPLAVFTIYRTPMIFNHVTGRWVNNGGKHLPGGYTGDTTESRGVLSKQKPGITPAVYERNINKIKEYIAAGETYQVNYTFRTKFEFNGEPSSLYNTLRGTQKVAYSAYISDGDTHILSFSPELYFRKTGCNIVMKPMKGTIRRGVDTAEDCVLADELHNSKKNRAENLMIVDLLRNDLGRIAVTGSVKVTKLFEVERYETLYQMTSTITAKLKPRTSLYRIMHTLYPSGSVTGSPKIRTMEIISSLENTPRGVYTGAVGFITPRGDAVFNVAIRTAVLKKKKSKKDSYDSELGIGSGIIWDSAGKDEHSECMLKAQFVYDKVKPFKLIETFLWSAEEHGYFLYAYHLNRLEKSAQYFGYRINLQTVNAVLRKNSGGFDKTKKYRVRMLVSPSGKVELENYILETTPAGEIVFTSNKVVVSKTRTRPEDKFLYHKTTNRELYDREHKYCAEKGYLGVIYFNTHGEVTEFGRANLAILKNGKYYTPPLNCGVLPGVYRRYFLKNNRNAYEKVLTCRDLVNADKIFMLNSVIGMVEVKLCNANKK